MKNTLKELHLFIENLKLEELTSIIWFLIHRCSIMHTPGEGHLCFLFHSGLIMRLVSRLTLAATCLRPVAGAGRGCQHAPGEDILLFQSFLPCARRLSISELILLQVFFLKVLHGQGLACLWIDFFPLSKLRSSPENLWQLVLLLPDLSVTS